MTEKCVYGWWVLLGDYSDFNFSDYKSKIIEIK